MHVLKVGGNELHRPEFRHLLAQAVAALPRPLVIVHGGGQAIADMQARLGLKTHKVDGLRVTNEESLAVAQMVLSGQVNKQIVLALLAEDVNALGISGVDGGLLRCRRKRHPSVDLGLVGEIESVRHDLLLGLLAQAIVPVISPISYHPITGQAFNVNADEAAMAVAKALRARLLTFISNVPGVLDGRSTLIPRLTAVETEALIANGVIHSGMVPKVRAAITVVGTEVPQARIVNLTGLANGGGTLFTT